MSKVYRIIEFNLIGKKLYTCEEIHDVEARLVEGKTKFFNKGTNTEALKSHRWTYSTSPKEDAIDPTKEKFMPYFAKVTEDVPQWVQKKGWEKTYDNCQLMTEKHGGYLQFWHEPTKQVLRIAMNSHIYEPIV